MYIRKHFLPEDKKAAEKITEYVFKSYKERVKEVAWIGEDAKEIILKKIESMYKCTGYDAKLDSKEGINFYENLTDFKLDNFFENAMSLKIFNANRAATFKGFDWAKYAHPHTVNAFFNAKLFSTDIPAGIIQVSVA